MPILILPLIAVEDGLIDRKNTFITIRTGKTIAAAE